MSQPKLAELNQYVPVHLLEGDLTEDTLRKYKAVVVTELPYSKQLEVSEVCHKNNIHFISAEVRGLFGRIFNDFGEKFEVIDYNGEEPLHGMVASVSKVCFCIFSVQFKTNLCLYRKLKVLLPVWMKFVTAWKMVTM